MERWQPPNSTPTFEVELAKLCRLCSSDQQARPITQYPSVELSYCNSSGHRRASATSTCFTPVAARNGSKRVRVSELHITVPSASSAVERLQLGTEEGTKTAILNSEFYGSPLEAGVYGKHSVHEPEHDPPETSDYDELNEHEESSDSSCDESDPCDVLDSNAFRLILSFLDVRSLGRCLAVSAAWQLCAQDDSLWDSACKQLWDGKIHIHPAAQDLSTPRLRAFQVSVADSKRILIEGRDLCTFVWELHFKEHTGEYWKQLDPYYRGLPLMRRIFHADGHITAEPVDQIWGGGHASSWTLRRSKSKAGPSLVQINHWPALAISRTPAWGWKMENAWVVYISTSEKVSSRTTENLLTTAPS